MEIYDVLFLAAFVIVLIVQTARAHHWRQRAKNLRRIADCERKMRIGAEERCESWFRRYQEHVTAHGLTWRRESCYTEDWPEELEEK